MAEQVGTGLWAVGEERVRGRTLRIIVGGLVYVLLERRALFGLLGEDFPRWADLEAGGVLGRRAEDVLLAAAAGIPPVVSDL